MIILLISCLIFVTLYLVKWLYLSCIVLGESFCKINNAIISNCHSIITESFVLRWRYCKLLAIRFFTKPECSCLTFSFSVILFTKQWRSVLWKSQDCARLIPGVLELFACRGVWQMWTVPAFRSAAWMGVLWTVEIQSMAIGLLQDIKGRDSMYHKQCGLFWTL